MTEVQASGVNANMTAGMCREAQHGMQEIHKQVLKCPLSCLLPAIQAATTSVQSSRPAMAAEVTIAVCYK